MPPLEVPLVAGIGKQGPGIEYEEIVSYAMRREQALKENKLKSGAIAPSDPATLQHRNGM